MSPLCLIATTCTLASTVLNLKVSLSSYDDFTNKVYSELVTGTMEVAMCCPYIYMTLNEALPDLVPTPDALVPLKSWITCRPIVRIFGETIILVVISYLILLGINLSFLWLAIFPVIAMFFIGALYFKFSPRTRKVTPGSSNVVVRNTNRKTRELEIIVMMTIGALLVMDQIPDHAADGFAISQFLLFLSSTVATLACMMMKLPGSDALPGIAPASEIFHKTLLLLLLVTAHTVAAEWLGEDIVLLCLPEVIPVLLWFSLQLQLRPCSSSIISVDKMKRHRKPLVFLSAVVIMVAPLIAYLVISIDELMLSSWCTTFLVSFGVSGILTYYLLFMLSHWPRKHAAAAANDWASGMLKVWACALLIGAAASLLLKCLLCVQESCDRAG